MPNPTAPTHPLPLVRACYEGGLRPILAPGERDTYFLPDLQRLLFGPDEPITRFLPPANLTMPDRQARSQSNAQAQVTYAIPVAILGTATPLTTLPRAEIEAFAEAAAEFLAKARDPKQTSYTRQCREHFRLPDPDLDPQAYWVYGSEFDRRLLILWGTESQKGVSLRLEQVVEKLRGREMSWRDKQALGLKLALREEEQLARFLALRTEDDGLQIDGVAVERGKLRPLKRVTPKTWQAFRAAAQAFYEQAHPDATHPDGSEIPPFEREMRSEFRLPGYRNKRDAYYATRAGFVIAIDDWERDATLPLTADSKLNLPEKIRGSVAAPQAAGATVEAQLAPIAKTPVAQYVALGTAALLVLAAIPLAIQHWPVSTPGQYVKDSLKWPKTADPREISLQFTRQIDPASLRNRPDDPPLYFVDRAARIVGDPILAKDGTQVTLKLEKPLEDGRDYTLVASNLVGRGNKPFEPKISVNFAYFDAIRPRILKTNAGDAADELRIFFSEPVREDSLVENRFAFEPVATPGDGRAAKVPRTSKVGLDKAYPANDVVLLKADIPFGGGMPYRLAVTGVRDLSRIDRDRGNEIEPEPFPFAYEDKLPPRILGATAEGGTRRIEIKFSKPVEPAKAKQESNYALVAPDGTPLALLPGGITLDQTGRNVTLTLRPAKFTAGKHQLKVQEVADVENRYLDRGLSYPFEFWDAKATGGPRVAGVRNEVGGPLIITFDRGPDDSAMEKGNYRILSPEQFPYARVTKVTPGNPREYELTTSRRLPAGKYLLEFSGIADPFGNRNEKPAFFGPFDYRARAEVTTPILTSWPANQPAVHKAGVVTLTIGDHIDPESARKVENYIFQPELEFSVKNVTAAKGQTKIELSVTGWPASGPVRVAIDGVLLFEAADYGAQKLPPIEITRQ